MCVDREGNAYLGGDFKGLLASFGYQVVNNHDASTDEIYFVKVDPSLNVVWARSFGGRANDRIL